MAIRTRSTDLSAIPETGGETVKPGLPVAELVAVTRAADLVGLVKRDERAVLQVELVDVVLRVAAVAPTALGPVLEDLLRVKLDERALARIRLPIRRAVAARARVGGETRNSSLDGDSRRNGHALRQLPVMQRLFVLVAPPKNDRCCEGHE